MLLLERVRVTEDLAECWLWQGPTDSRGYGRASRGKLAHRLVYAKAYGEDPGDLCVCHSCDTPTCCNPSHFFLGDRAANNRDMRSKKRHAHGEEHTSSRYTNGVVQWAVEEYRSGRWTQTALARLLQVNQSTISDWHRNIKRTSRGC